MKLWRKAAGAVKDQNSILLASFLTPRSSSRDGSLEAAIIKATSHDGDSVDYRNAQRMFEWIRTSPVSLKPLVWGLSVRMERTQSWVVALKGLMLMHGIFCCNTPAVHRIGRLPFDLSGFADGHSHPTKVWGYNTFVRSYFTFLDRRSSLLYPTFSTNHKCRRISSKRTSTTTPPAVNNEEDNCNHDDHDVVMMITKVELWQEIQKLQKWQKLLDLLLQIKPLADNMKRNALIMEAMDCVVVEIFDLYSNICSGVSRVLMEVHLAGKAESTMALRLLQKARVQGKNLVLYFEFCRAFGVFSAMEVPKVTPIPEEDIKHMASGVSELEEMVAKKGGDYYKATSDAGAGVPCHEKSYKKAAMGDDDGELKKNVSSITASGRLQTVITDEWEVFDDDNDRDSVGTYGDLLSICDVVSSPPTNPFEMPDDQLMDLLSTLPTPIHEQHQLQMYKQDELPDLISF
ncbi:unnamed protein product [Linum tenue]|uniref:ENTH domain-containing protein n=1 Tax=Linum tenue TaxID=586396 RepID=A0AAV0NI73_9ROSI|nr:unnamed protein product [Linum tenue]